MKTHRRSKLRAITRVSVTLLLSFTLSACAQTVASTGPTPALSPQEKSDLIERLEVAKRTDWNDALDSNVGPTAEADFLDQMNKADRVIKELSHGFDVPQTQSADALWVPPKSITSRERDRLIRELEEARREDDHNEQRMLNLSAWTDSVAPVDTVKFDEQKQLVDRVVKDLEIGEGVHWSTIKEALYVPTSPD
jgi:hypothetical protein